MTLHLELMDAAILLAMFVLAVGALAWIFQSSIRLNDFTRLGITYKDFALSIETKRSTRKRVEKSMRAHVLNATEDGK
jgi:hypothetical protein